MNNRLHQLSRWQSSRHHGFSLLELSIVLIVVGILASTIVTPLGSAVRQAHIRNTSVQLTNIRRAMHGYLIATGRLPCPINLALAAQANHSEQATCQFQHGGVPARELGVPGEQSARGALLDAWGVEYRYSVSFADHQERGQQGKPDWLTAGEPAMVGASHLLAELELCRAQAARQCANADLIANQIVWVVHSKGALNSEAGLQSENSDNDLVFVHSAYSSNDAKPFDDLLIWASKSELIYWLLKANWLP